MMPFGGQAHNNSNLSQTVGGALDVGSTNQHIVGVAGGHGEVELQWSIRHFLQAPSSLIISETVLRPPSVSWVPTGMKPRFR